MPMITKFNKSKSNNQNKKFNHKMQISYNRNSCTLSK